VLGTVANIDNLLSTAKRKRDACGRCSEGQKVTFELIADAAAQGFIQDRKNVRNVAVLSRKT
jgi:hypothetical protein